MMSCAVMSCLVLSLSLFSIGLFSAHHLYPRYMLASHTNNGLSSSCFVLSLFLLPSRPSCRHTRWLPFLFFLSFLISLLVCWPPFPFFFSLPASSPIISLAAFCAFRAAALHCSSTFVPVIFCGSSLHLTEKNNCTVHSTRSHVSIVGWVCVSCVIFSGGFS